MGTWLQWWITVWPKRWGSIERSQTSDHNDSASWMDLYSPICLLIDPQWQMALRHLPGSKKSSEFSDSSWSHHLFCLFLLIGTALRSWPGIGLWFILYILVQVNELSGRRNEVVVIREQKSVGTNVLTMRRYIIKHLRAGTCVKIRLTKFGFEHDQLNLKWWGHM